MGWPATQTRKKLVYTDPPTSGWQRNCMVMQAQLSPAILAYQLNAELCVLRS